MTSSLYLVQKWLLLWLRSIWVISYDTSEISWKTDKLANPVLPFVGIAHFVKKLLLLSAEGVYLFTRCLGAFLGRFRQTSSFLTVLVVENRIAFTRMEGFLAEHGACFARFSGSLVEDDAAFARLPGSLAKDDALFTRLSESLAEDDGSSRDLRYFPRRTWMIS